MVDGLRKFFADHGYRYFPPTFANIESLTSEERLNTKENFVELLGLVLGVAMQCDQSRDVILKITEMDEQFMNELQGAYEHVVEMYLAGAGPILDVSREKYFTQNSHNISGLNLCRSGSAFTKSHNRSHIIGKDRYDNDLSDMMKSEDFDSENISNSSFNVVNRNDP